MSMDEPAYIARAACGCIVMAIAVVDESDWKKHTANEIAKAIRRGLSVERVPAQYVRDNMKACPHKREKKTVGRDPSEPDQLQCFVEEK